MAVWQNYFKILEPQSKISGFKPIVNDTVQISNYGYGALSSVSWLSNIIQGASTRLMRYKQYENMDSGFVSRALDIIAEEMTDFDANTDLPFIIKYNTEDSQEIDESTSTTLRAALRYWSSIQDLETS